MYLDVSSRLGDVREDSSLFCTLHSNTRCKETFNTTPSFHQNGFGILIICQPAGLPLGNLTCSRSSQTQNSMSSSRLASGGCLFCVIATGQRWAGSYAWVWTWKLWRVFSCKNLSRYWNLREQIEDCLFVWTYALRPILKNTFETISLHCWRFICLLTFISYIETWLSTLWKQKVLVRGF